MGKVLFVNACIKRCVPSRTLRLAKAYLAERCKDQSDGLETVDLEDLRLAPLSGRELAVREEAIQKEDFSAAVFDFARDFRSAEEVVIAAPYWDMSFPAVLKVYLEHLCVNKFTFGYGETGAPRSLCNVKKVVYITTAGGMIGAANFGFEYVKGLFAALFGVADFSFFGAEGLDIFGNDPEAILKAAIDKMLSKS